VSGVRRVSSGLVASETRGGRALGRVGVSVGDAPARRSAWRPVVHDGGRTSSPRASVSCPRRFLGRLLRRIVRSSGAPVGRSWHGDRAAARRGLSGRRVRAMSRPTVTPPATRVRPPRISRLPLAHRHDRGARGLCRLLSTSVPRRARSAGRSRAGGRRRQARQPTTGIGRCRPGRGARSPLGANRAGTSPCAMDQRLGLRGLI